MTRILVAEDDAGTRLQVAAILTVEGYTVQSAIDGAAAFEMAKTRVPDIIIADVEMPEMSGPELCAAVRGVERLRHCYVIMLTSRGDKEAKLDALRAGADDFIVKPARPGELLGHVEVGLRVIAAESGLRDAARSAEAARARVSGIRKEMLDLSKHLGDAGRAMGVDDGPGARRALDEARPVLERAIKACDG